MLDNKFKERIKCFIGNVISELCTTKMTSVHVAIRNDKDMRPRPGS